jgi:hypothetical protein
MIRRGYSSHGAARLAAMAAEHPAYKTKAEELLKKTGMNAG